jgi:hypothetical protein
MLDASRSMTARLSFRRREDHHDTGGRAAQPRADGRVDRGRVSRDVRDSTRLRTVVAEQAVSSIEQAARQP